MITTNNNKHGGAMLIRIAQAGFLGLCIWIVAANAEPGAAGSITTKPNGTSDIPEIQRIIQTHQLSLTDAFLERAGGHSDIVSFCETFLIDLKAGRVEYIRPVLTTNDPNHPELKRFQSCRNHVHTPDELKQGAGVYRDLSEIGTHSFRLYRLDIDGNPGNGLEEVVYGEKERLPTKDPEYSGSLSLFGSYVQANTKSCMRIYTNSTLLQSDFDGTKDGKTTPILYRGVPYIVVFSWREPKTELKNLRPAFVGVLWGSDDAPGLHNRARCSFSGNNED